jgi:hypothetical protein
MGSSCMVYTINQKVITLEEYGYRNFRDELIRLGKENKLYDKRNIEWFDILPNTFFDYEEWFFLFDDDKPVAFSTIQKYNEGTYRLLTRTYIYRDYRRFTNPKNDTFHSPTMRLLPHQLNYIKGYSSAFVSMQSISRRPAIERFAVKMKYRTHLDWDLAPNMMLTCSGDYGKDCWQSIIYNGVKPNLQEMTIGEWKDKWQKSV